MTIPLLALLLLLGCLPLNGMDSDSDMPPGNLRNTEIVRRYLTPFGHTSRGSCSRDSYSSSSRSPNSASSNLSLSSSPPVESVIFPSSPSTVSILSTRQGQHGMDTEQHEHTVQLGSLSTEHSNRLMTLAEQKKRILSELKRQNDPRRSERLVDALLVLSVEQEKLALQIQHQTFVLTLQKKLEDLHLNPEARSEILNGLNANPSSDS